MVDDENARELLHSLIADNPKADRSKVLALFIDRALKSSKYWRPIVENWAEANWLGQKHASSSAAEEKIRIKEKIVSKFVNLLTAVVLPTGNSLGLSTFEECKSAGGWLTTLASKGEPKQVVGDVLSSQEVLQIWKAAVAANAGRGSKHPVTIKSFADLSAARNGVTA